jgi:1,4-dihydroxy-2-naphthoyl-CoA hydrolase
MSDAAKSPWFRQFTLEEIHGIERDTMVEHLGIEFTRVGPDFVEARMPVDRRTVQPYRTLHGGASVALAETLGSVGASMTIDLATSKVVGMSINASHLRGVRSGHVTGTARPLHLGGSSQVWDIEIVDEAGRRVCVARLTLAVLPRAPGDGPE